jgi:hypothetical protein
MGMLQERADLTERDLATYRHDVGTLRAERDHLVNQVGACCTWQQQGHLQLCMFSTCWSRGCLS